MILIGNGLLYRLLLFMRNGKSETVLMHLYQNESAWISKMRSYTITTELCKSILLFLHVNFIISSRFASLLGQLEIQSNDNFRCLL